MQLKQFYNIATKVSSRKKMLLFLVFSLTAEHRHTSAENRPSQQPGLLSVLANRLQTLLMSLQVYNALKFYVHWLAQAVLRNGIHNESLEIHEISWLYFLVIMTEPDILIELNEYKKLFNAAFRQHFVKFTHIRHLITHVKPMLIHC